MATIKSSNINITDLDFEDVSASLKEYLKGLGGELIMTTGLTASISRNRKAELFKKLYLDK